jgi:hypothetical protein
MMSPSWRSVAFLVAVMPACVLNDPSLAGKQCTSDGVCVFGYSCVNTVCVPNGSVGTSCASSPCLGGLTCLGGTCAQTCQGAQCTCGGANAPLCGMQAGVCQGAVASCDGDGGWILPCTTANYQANSPNFGLEVCDGLDNNCDGQVDEGLTPPPCSNQKGVCDGSVETCGGGAGWLDCTAANYQANSPSYGPEVCDGLDNDCNGTVDDGLTDPSPHLLSDPSGPPASAPGLAMSFELDAGLLAYVVTGGTPAILLAPLSPAGALQAPASIAYQGQPGDPAFASARVASEGNDFVVAWIASDQVLVSQASISETPSVGVSIVKSAYVASSFLTVSPVAPNLVSLDASTYALAWEDDSSGPESVIWFGESSEEVVTSNERLSGPMSSSAPVGLRQPSLAVDGDGGLWATYTLEGSPAASIQLVPNLQALPDGGTTAGGQTWSDSSAAATQSSLGFWGSTPVVAWAEQSDSGDDLRVRVGSAASNVVAFANTVAEPEVVTGPNGALVSWQDDHAGSFRVYAARVTLDGGLTAPVSLALSDGGVAQLPSSTYTGSTYLVAWQADADAGSQIWGRAVCP